MSPLVAPAAQLGALAFLGASAVYAIVTFGLLFYELANGAGSSRREGGPRALAPAGLERAYALARLVRCVALEWLMTVPIGACSLLFSFVPERAWRRVRWSGVGRPIAVLHGYSHNPAHLWLLARRVHRVTRRPVHLVRLTPPFGRIETMAERLGARLAELAADSGHARIDLVAHSMGGVVARTLVQLQDGDAHVGRLVTVGTPHAGTRVAVFGPGACARQLVPGSRLLNLLASTNVDAATRITTTIWSTHDNIVVPPVSARLGDGACHRQLRYYGHTTLLVSRTVVSHVVAALGATDARALPLGGVGGEDPEDDDRFSAAAAAAS